MTTHETTTPHSKGIIHHVTRPAGQHDVTVRIEAQDEEGVARLLRDAIRIVTPEQDSPDLMDGGVASAVIETEAEERECGTPCSHETDSSWWQDRWKEAADWGSARDLAAHQWKKATREHVLRARTAKAYAEGLKTAVPVLHARAEKAEQQRDEARATKNLHKERADRERARADAAEQPRPLTPDDFQALIQKAETTIARRVRALDPSRNFQPSALRLADAIYRGIKDSQRPEGAEAFDPIIDAAIRGHSDITAPDVVHAIADALADEGVRAPGAES